MFRFIESIEFIGFIELLESFESVRLFSWVEAEDCRFGSFSL